MIKKNHSSSKQPNSQVILSNFSFHFFILFSDIALIKLPWPVMLSKTVQPVPLFTSSVSPGAPAFTMGFGHITDKLTATTLQFTRVITADLQKCVSNTSNLISKNSVICAGGQAAICEGDVGNPLVSSTFGKLIGIASYADKNGDSGHMHGFTGIYAYRQWIEGVMEGELS